MIRSLFVILILIVGCGQNKQAESSNKAGEKEVRLRVVQCWDDSPITDTTLVALLKKHDAKATFNIIPLEERIPIFMKKKQEGDSVLFSFYPKDQPKAGTVEYYHMSLEELPEVYRGFKVAGHKRFPLGGSMEETAERMASLKEVKLMISQMFGQERIGYVYPGGNYTPEAMEDVEEAGYVYARTSKSKQSIVNLSSPFDLKPSCHWASPDFWTLYEKAKKEGGVFYFWGHSVEMGDDPKLWAWLESIFKRISEDPESEWVDVVDLFY